MTQYIALIHKDPDSDYGVRFPDFPGCVTAGTTLQDAQAMAAEALRLHVAGMTADGEDIPAPSTLDEVAALPEFAGAVVILVPLAKPDARTMRVNITLPADVLEQIDAYAEKEGFTRSGFIVRAAKRAMAEAG